MLHYPTLPKHKSKRKLKKYSYSKLRKDKTFCGIKVYTYNIGDYCYLTSKPKQKGSKAYSYKYALWLAKYFYAIYNIEEPLDSLFNALKRIVVDQKQER